MHVQRVKDVAKVYDIKTVFHLELDNRKLFGIKCLSHCTNIVTLDLSCNKIQDISPLSNLKHLKRLNVSNNRISKLHELCTMEQLEAVNLEGNEIESFIQIAHLSSVRHFPALLHVSFQSLDRKTSNPICDEASYLQRVFDVFASRSGTFHIVSIDHRRITANQLDRALKEWRRCQQDCIGPESKAPSPWIEEEPTKNECHGAANDLKFQALKNKLETCLRRSKNELSKVNLDLKKYGE